MLSHVRAASSGKHAGHPQYTASSAPGAMPRDRAPGLVSERISPEASSSQVVVCPNGLDIRSKGKSGPLGAGGRRGSITGISQASRRRMLRTLLRLDYNLTCADWVTLTYHREWGRGPEVWHAHLDRWIQQLQADYSSFGPSAFWVLEFQKRGAPHFHPLVIWRRSPAEHQFRSWTLRTWHEIAEPTSEEHSRAGTRVDRIRSGDRQGARRILFYLVKYSSKQAQKRALDPETGELCPTGRMWGKTRDLPQTELASIHLDASETAILLRRLRRWGRRSRYLSRMGKRYNGGTVIGDGRTLAQLLRGIGGVASEQAMARGP